MMANDDLSPITFARSRPAPACVWLALFTFMTVLLWIEGNVALAMVGSFICGMQFVFAAWRVSALRMRLEAIRTRRAEHAKLRSRLFPERGQR